MKDQIITHKTSILAQEKGYDWMGARRETYIYGRDPKLKDSEFKLYCLWDIDVNYWIISDITLAPTQGLLAKWLREKHNIVVNIEAIPNYTKEPKCLSYYIDLLIHSDYMEEELPSTRETIYNTYEEALESALEKALNLIKDDK
jgi:hypothetical protein